MLNNDHDDLTLTENFQRLYCVDVKFYNLISHHKNHNIAKLSQNIHTPRSHEGFLDVSMFVTAEELPAVSVYQLFV